MDNSSILDNSGAPALEKLSMLRKIFILLLPAIFLRAATIPLYAAPDAADEIRAVLTAQQEAWNRGDIDAFMNGYWHSDKTVFVSGDEITRGWQTVRDRYQTKYPDREKMGALAFSDLEIMKLSADSAVVLGRWQLKRANDEPHGRFTLILRKFPEGWRIVHDHTSAAKEKFLRKQGTQESS
jgi:ketosteroid isomerase-like protein